MLAENAGGVGSNRTENKICFSHFRVECEKLFCKTNIKTTKVLKINKNLFSNKLDAI